MKSIITLLPLTVALLAVSTHAQEDQLPPTPAGQTWKLVWQDEFDGTDAGRQQVGHSRNSNDVTATGHGRPSRWTATAIWS